MAGEKILLADDEADIREIVVCSLKKKQMEVLELERGKDVIPSLEAEEFDLVLLDLILGDSYGFDILKEIRRRWPRLPVIMISGESAEAKKVTGFQLDVDDYIVKPFSGDELVARVQRHIRRNEAVSLPEGSSRKSFSFGSLRFDSMTGVLYKNSESISLSGLEYKILKFFLEHPGQILSPDQIFEHCWNQDSDHVSFLNNLRVYIRKLRKHIEDDPGKPQYLQTVNSLGYKFVPKK